MQIGFESFKHDKKERNRDRNKKTEKNYEIQYFL